MSSTNNKLLLNKEILKLQNFFPCIKILCTHFYVTFSLQTDTVQGLDGCASLLRDILRNEDSGFLLNASLLITFSQLSSSLNANEFLF